MLMNSKQEVELSLRLLISKMLYLQKQMISFSTPFHRMDRKVLASLYLHQDLLESCPSIC